MFTPPPGLGAPRPLSSQSPFPAYRPATPHGGTRMGRGAAAQAQPGRGRGARARRRRGRPGRRERGLARGAAPRGGGAEGTGRAGPPPPAPPSPPLTRAGSGRQRLGAEGASRGGGGGGEGGGCGGDRLSGRVPPRRALSLSCEMLRMQHLDRPSQDSRGVLGLHGGLTACRAAGLAFPSVCECFRPPRFMNTNPGFSDPCCTTLGASQSVTWVHVL